MSRQNSILYYVHDPMCSWCWAFAPAWQQVQAGLQSMPIRVEYLLGGLAPDTDAPMPQTLRHTLQETWRRIQRQVPGTEFNFDFWSACRPRRATWPACRAVLAADSQRRGLSMIDAIQRAYYLRAMNPSEDATLLQLAQELGLDGERFARDFNSPQIAERLQEQMRQARRLPISGFPSLVLHTATGHHPIAVDYNAAENILRTIGQVIQQEN